MGTLEKLKAYFGMVPAEDQYDLPEEYADEPEYRREPRGYRSPQPREDDYAYDEPAPRVPARTRAARRVEDLDDLEVPVRGRVRGTAPQAPAPVSSGALAMDRAPEPVSRLRPVEAPPVTRDPLSRIVTLHPSNYAEARGIGEAFRDGNPVIMNLTEMDNADAKRLVDFAAGLAFALRGSMDKVTNKVFLLSPSDADVSAEDRQRIAEGGLFLRR